MRRFLRQKAIFILGSVLIMSTTVKTQALTGQKNSVTIYLTFDDGPLHCSWHLLSLIRTNSFPVNVFLVGQQVYHSQEGKDILQSYRDNPLVEIDNHSFCHAHRKYKAFYRHPKEVIEDMLLNEDTLQLTNKIIRLPGRNVWRINGRKRNDLAHAKRAADSLASRGYRIFGWDLEWRYDSTTQSFYSATRMIRWIRQLVESGKTFLPQQIVILCHDPMLQNEYERSQLRLFAGKIKMETDWHLGHLIDYPEN